MTRREIHGLLYGGLSSEFNVSYEYNSTLGWESVSLLCVREKSNDRSKINVRTANRHRWFGRVDLGKRVMVVQGTRQKS
jgi:hypothetical protein